MKLQLVARPGHAPVAVLVDASDPGCSSVAAYDLAKRLLGPSVEWSLGLSHRWNLMVFGQPEFLDWWLKQDRARRPDRADVIFLEVLNG